MTAHSLLLVLHEGWVSQGSTFVSGVSAPSISAEPAERVRAVLPWAGTFTPPVSQHRSNTVSILAPLASATGVLACTPETLRATHQQRGRRRGSSWAQ